jgi:uncharacterized protein (DUF924 family)
MESGEVFRFMERNQATLRDTDHGKHRFTQFRPRLNALIEILTGPDAPPRSRIRSAAALFAANASCMFFANDALAPEADQAQPLDRDELHKIVLELAEDLAGDTGAA